MHIYIDSTYMVHTDGKGHTGLYLTLGKGIIINILKKLELVTTSSTEMEVVANGEHFLKCI